jgi:hypothetical protein
MLKIDPTPDGYIVKGDKEQDDSVVVRVAIQLAETLALTVYEEEALCVRVAPWGRHEELGRVLYSATTPKRGLVTKKGELAHALKRVAAERGSVDSVNGGAVVAGVKFPKFFILEHAYMAQSLILATTMRSVELSSSDNSRSVFVGCDMTGAFLGNGRFSEAMFAGGSLNRISAIATDFRGASLSGCTARGADFTDAIFTGARLEEVDLKGAKLPLYAPVEVTWQTDGTATLNGQTMKLLQWDELFDSPLTESVAGVRRGTADFARLEAAYAHAKAMYSIWWEYES